MGSQPVVRRFSPCMRRFETDRIEEVPGCTGEEAGVW